jgi:hypothetical protein
MLYFKVTIKGVISFRPVISTMINGSFNNFRLGVKNIWYPIKCI